ncbi:MAG TPA: type II toxin-antitoxin system RelE/ParE family toxin [Thermoanaerobaculia bacterium]|nr:type II toxin-antitoxin system RelE/ParE family toxin [Thermoanaerobaculia bacterium]
MHARLHRAASRELRESAVFLEEQRSGYGHRLLASATEKFEFLVRFPASGKRTLGGARRLSLDGFPYDVVYVLRPDEIYIIAIAHHRRDPNYWLPRIR